ncbi:MAG: Gfo/Idh/MocA family oxidoreductase [Chloroflexi bacterium]|nr:Gfo/Idh/MocA family oxidoreductase [Chloroflexota bacterium]
MKEMNVAIIGYKFMGKAHSNAWKNVTNFFDVPIKPVMKVACGRDKDAVQAFADNWGWEEIETDWKNVVERDDIDIIDISTPPNLHYPIALAAAKAGKHIFCEKPIALSADEALKMYEAAEDAGVVHYVNHNYRRCPAVMLAKEMIDDGKLGQIYHWRGCYLQSWTMDPNFPLTWHMIKDQAGMGSNGGINSHSVDLARFLVGEIKSVTGMMKTFIKERPLPGAGAATFSAGSGEVTEKGKVELEDAISMIVEFENGALGSFDATTFAIGRENYNYFEIYGSKGAVIFNLERMNELQYYSSEDAVGEKGFRTILATDPSHPYIANWWPPAHNIGYEHEFHHAVVDFLKGVDSGGGIQPNFYDGYLGMKVLEAGINSAESKKQIEIK